jgi:predicted dinucleotide-binding enzyme
MTNSESPVAIIGTGNIGGTLAKHFASGGQDFLLAGRDAETVRTIAASLGGRAEAVSVDEAVQRADVIVPAVWFDVFKQLITQYGPQLAGKVATAFPDEAEAMAPAQRQRSRAAIYLRSTHSTRRRLLL